MSDSIAHKLWLVPEIAFGVAVITPTLTYCRNIGCTLALTKEGFESEEARADRAVPDYRHGNRAVGGDISFEFSFASFDNLLEAVYCGASWADKRADFIQTDISAATADDSFNDLSGNMPIFGRDELIAVSGFGSANDATYLVTSSTGSKLIVRKPDGTPATNIVNETAGESITITSFAEFIKTGATRRSFNGLRQFTDQIEADKPFHLYLGLMVNAFNLTVAPGGNIKGSFTLLGKNLVLGGTAPAGATLGTPNANRVFDSFTGALYEGGSLLGKVTEITMKVENGFEAQYVCFDDTTIDPSIGKSRVSGQMGIHFTSSAMMEKFINETPSDLVFWLKDKDGNRYLFRFPRIVYNGGQPDTAAQGSIILTMPFMALYDATSDAQASLERYPAS